jgi:hypothetical protein
MREQQNGLTHDQLSGMLGKALAGDDEYLAGAIGAAALLGGVNLNQALSGSQKDDK